MGKHRVDDLYYASTAIKVMEAKAAPKDILNKIIDARDFDEAKKYFSDAKFGKDENQYFEDALNEEINRLYDGVSEVLEDEGKEISDIFRYPYDCQNI